MTTEKLLERKGRVLEMLAKLHELFPDAHTALQFSTPWELLVATILSAQTLDTTVNVVTENLFKKYPKLDSFAQLDQLELAKDISSVNFFQNKAKFIINSAKLIKEEFGGEVPKTMEELLTLPGVARKTANVVLGSAYGITSGIVVDTHVMRLSQKFDLTDSKDPAKIEKDLMEIVPKEEWIYFAHAMIWYGRKYCPARPHDCVQDPMYPIFPPSAARGFGRAKESASRWPKK